MCGITGIFNLDDTAINHELLERMTDLLGHRGPDDRGIWLHNNIGLGHRRLAIIGLEDSKQPMPKGQACITYNGEIFNYKSIRRDLELRGSDFFSSGDTEVLLELLNQQGLSGASSLNGQFSFAYFDKLTDTLTLCRDRLGILPLYYYQDSKRFIFSSEIKSILMAIDDLQIDFKSLHDYLNFRSVPAPNTLFSRIKKVLPGCYLTIDSAGRLVNTRYWSVPNNSDYGNQSANGWITRVSSAITEAVQSRLVADVPVGMLLSGGIDSSLICAMVAKHQPDFRLQTYTAGFSVARYDETPYASQVAKMLGAEEHRVNICETDFEKLWNDMTWYRDAPLSEPADIIVNKLAREASKDVKVLLSGEGADEIFAGYPKYRFAQLASHALKLPKAVRAQFFNLIYKCIPESAYKRQLRVMLRTMSESSEREWFASWFAPFTSYERSGLFDSPPNRAFCNTFSRAKGDLVARMQYVDCHHWLSDNLLDRGDKMAMAAGVEIRPPFLDHSLVELALSIPTNFKIRDGQSKWVLKKIAEQYLPNNIIYRQKNGFRVPLDSWFRSGLRDMAHDLLTANQSFIVDTFNKKTVNKLLDSHGKGVSDESIRIWTLASLEIWYQKFIKTPVSSSNFECRRPEAVCEY